MVDKEDDSISPWNYDDNKFNISGLICLNYAPVWFIDGILAEALYVNNFFLLLRTYKNL